MEMEWSINEVAKLAGITSRTLRHYDAIGLVPPSRVGHNGYRYYDGAALTRLPRVLLLRDLGVGLPEIDRIIREHHDEAAALHTHLALLAEEKDRLERQIRAVEHTLRGLADKEKLMAQSMLDGFDHTQYKDEVEERWGARAYADSDAWWRGMSITEQSQWTERVAALNASWIAAAADPSITPDSPQAQELAERHVEWLRSVPGTPAAQPGGDLPGYVRGLGEMYVADERFAANYGGVAGAEFVRDTLIHWLEHRG